MDLAIAAATFAVARAGASTVSEFSAVGLPAVYVPYPVGNGEQKHNLVSAEAVGGAISVDDKDFDLEFISNQLVPLISDTRRVEGMALAVRSIGIADGAERLYRLVRGVLS
jgi:UDP-N-acetylglucosamine--N-acetylmuramyl-(pentapeptide) pyrophosphoryl-undecaprenol N-acetylglucosamine transferase